jgi:hypothetical protein
MQIRIGLENGIEGRALAWVLDYPGCFAYGKDGTEAILRTPQALITYREWVADHIANSWLQNLEDFDIALAEIFECYKVAENGREYEVNAWFNDDLRPLSREEIERGIALLEWSRSDLQSLVSPLTPAQLEQKFTSERWSIAGVVQHIAKANMWYLDRLNLTSIDVAKAGSGIFERLDLVHQELVKCLPELAGKNAKVEVNHETWSPRKVLRRAIWHMRDHHFHIERLLSLL